MSDQQNIRLTLGDWQWNASIVGFINIVGKDNVHFNEDSIEFPISLLDGFEEKYFEYLISTYLQTLSWYRITSVKSKLEKYQKELDNFDLESLKELNGHIKYFKEQLKSSSYKSAYKLIGSEAKILGLEKSLKTIGEPKNSTLFEKNKTKLLGQASQNISTMKQVIDYCLQPEAKRYIAAKNVIYNIIKHAWNDISFLNPKTKEKDMYIDYQKHFANDAINYIHADKSKFAQKCFVCDSLIDNSHSNSMCFLNETGFDVARKTSNAWNFKNDVIICPLCKLIYSCLPAGIAYVYGRGIYVNANMTAESAFNINHSIKSKILAEVNNRAIYASLVNSLHQQENNSYRYEFIDIQVVRFENNSYRFNILSRKMLEILVEFQKDLDKLTKAVIVSKGKNKSVFYIHNDVVSRIVNNQNLFPVIHRLLHHKISKPEECYYNNSHLFHLIKINQAIYKSLGGLKLIEIKEEQNLIHQAKTAGYLVRIKYQEKDSENKLPGICYRLLNALKTSNKNMFMDVALNCYLYIKSSVPWVITDSLSNDKDFSTMGYAFVASLIDDSDKKSNGSSESKEENNEVQIKEEL
jgi:CRISPR-associated protein Cst1